MGLLSRLAGAVSRGLGRVAEALGLAPAPAPPPPPEPPRPAPSAPRPAPSVKEAPLPPPPRIEIATPSAAEVARWRLEAADTAGAVWAAQRGPLEGPALAELRELKSLDTRAGEPFLGRGHPDLLEPLELLERYGGRSEEAALVELSELAAEDLSAAARLETLRAEARASWAEALEAARAEARVAVLPPELAEALEPPELVPLQGSAISSEGSIEESIRDVWGRWVVSSLAGLREPPPMVVTVLGQVITIPPEVMREGPAAILTFIGQVLDLSEDWYDDAEGRAEIGGFEARRYKVGKKS